MADIQSVIQETLDDLVGSGHEVGLQAAVYLDGELIADCVAGVVAENSSTAVSPQTLFTIFSCSKGPILTAFHMLAQRGLIDYEKPVAHYWSEFGVAGKESITISQVMNSVAGIPQTPVLPNISPPDLWCDLERVVEETAKLEPMFTPGTTSCYHGLTIGWVLAGLVKRVDGRTLGQLVRDEIAIPLNIQNELFLGTPAEAQERMAMAYDAPVNEEDLPELDPIFFEVIPPVDEPLGAIFTHPHVRSAEIPGGNISASARALAKHYAATVSEVDGCRLISNDHLNVIFSHQADLPDVFMNKTFGIRQETPRILGYQRNTGKQDQVFYYGNNLRAFGHDGYGGATGFADPQLKLGFGYTKTLLHMFTLSDQPPKLRVNRPIEMSKTRVIRALYDSIS